MLPRRSLVCALRRRRKHLFRTQRRAPLVPGPRCGCGSEYRSHPRRLQLQRRCGTARVRSAGRFQSAASARCRPSDSAPAAEARLRQKAAGKEQGPDSDLPLPVRPSRRRFPVRAGSRPLPRLPLALHPDETTDLRCSQAPGAHRDLPRRRLELPLPDRQEPLRVRSLRAVCLTIASLAVVLALGAAPAAATFHLVQIRELYPGSAAAPESEYVELQMWASGQNHVEGHVLRSYDSGGAVTGTFSFAHDVAGEANQSTLLLATPQAESQFGVVADAPLTPGALSPAGGAVCWESIDCVTWGSFSGTLPSPAGTPAAAAGIPDGMALRRTIARGCATLLDPADDNDNSVADFTTVFPLPRPNSVAPSERPCSGSAPGGGTGGGGGP